MASVRFSTDDYTPPDYIDVGPGGETGGKAATPNPFGGTVGSPGRPVDTYTPTPSRYTLTPNWQDPLTPPQPQDPYYAEVQRANPGNPLFAAAAAGPQWTGSAPATTS